MQCLIITHHKLHQVPIKQCWSFTFAGHAKIWKEKNKQTKKNSNNWCCHIFLWQHTHRHIHTHTYKHTHTHLSQTAHKGSLTCPSQRKVWVGLQLGWGLWVRRWTARPPALSHTHTHIHTHADSIITPHSGKSILQHSGQLSYTNLLEKLSFYKNSYHPF